MSEPLPTPAPDWPHLIDAVVRGEGDALGRWYALEWPRVFRLCFGFLTEHAEAEDAAQDAMLHLSDRLARWTPTRPYPAWRNRVVLNLCRDWLRRRAARSDAEEGAARRALPGVLPDPAEEAARGETERTLALALGALPEREREAFVLRDLEGASTEAAASAMGIGASSVRSLLTLARRRLRTLLAPSLAPEGGSR